MGGFDIQGVAGFEIQEMAGFDVQEVELDSIQELKDIQDEVGFDMEIETNLANTPQQDGEDPVG